MEVEADHVSITVSPERAVKRIAGGGFEAGLSDAEVEEALRYIEEEMREVQRHGGVDFVTVDTCELIDFTADRMGLPELEARYEELLDPDERRALEKLYLGRVYRFLGNGVVYEVRFSREEVMRLAVKYWRSLAHVPWVLDIARRYIEGPFGVEVAFDETPSPTPPKDLVFYLSELRRLGVDPDFIAPNVGFAKREDYTGDLEELRSRIIVLSAIARGFGTALSFHSGSGAHPYSDKGPGVLEVVREATGGLLKYKVSGVYIQLLLEVMSRFPQGSPPRRLYEEIFDYVLGEVRRYVSERTGLYTPALEDMLKRYESAEGRRGVRNPRADFFRHYFFLFQAAFDPKRGRWLREEVLRLYSENRELRDAYEREATELTLRLVGKLGFTGNLYRFRIRAL
ncbi:MAG: hypothetical protein DRO39_08605 [Thermoprotei archaeon]|nr:MAG: hypothetical protein DRO39_08605 [Thermoprotei archaeon]